MKNTFKKTMTQIKGNFDLQELLKGSFKSFIAKILGMTFGFLMVLFISNVYGAEELGMFSISLTVLNIAVLVPKFGFEQSLVRILGEVKIRGNKNDFYQVLKKSTTLSFILSIIAAIIIYFIAEVLAIKVFKNEDLVPYIKSVVYAIPPTTLLVIASSTFQALKKTFNYTLYKTGYINIVFTIFLVLNHYILKQFEDTFLMYTAATYFVFFCGTLLLKKYLVNYPFVENTSLDIKTRYIVKTSVPMLYSSSFALLIGWSNIILLGYFTSEYDVGIYDSAERIAALSSIALIAINSIVAPKFAEAYANNDNKQLESVTRKSTKMIFVSTTPILIVLIVFGKYILRVFGEEFIVGYWVLVLLCISKFLSAIAGSVGYLLQMTGRQKIYLNVIMIAFVINLILDLILIPKYGYIGAAVASSIAIVFGNITSAIIVKKKLGFWTFYIPFIVK